MAGLGVRDMEHFERLVDAGVDVICTNDPDQLVELRSRVGGTCAASLG